MATKSAAKFWNKIADKYAKQSVKDEAAYQHKLDKTQEYLRADMEVLEFGCGTGTTAIYHAPKVKHILATDISDRMIEIAKEKAVVKNVDNITFRVATIEELDLPEQSIDLIMAHSILHLLADEKAVIDKVMRSLKPGGIFVSSTVCVGSGFSLWKVLIPILQLIGKAPPVRMLSKEGLLNSITKAGFIIDYQWQQEAKIAVPFVIARKPESSSR